MVDKCIDCMKKGKAGGIDGQTIRQLRANNVVCFKYEYVLIVSTFCSDYALDLSMKCRP